MREEDNILQKCGRETGFAVPEGYFAAMRQEVMTRLSDCEPVRTAPKISLWQRVRPYVYMAAMFAGIWCMMKMFHSMTQQPELSLDNLPGNVALAMADVHEYYVESGADVKAISDTELENAVGASYSDIDDFARDFGYEIEPQYENLTPNE